MAEFAKVVKENHCVIRKAGAITIDNGLYQRYSGELQVVTKSAIQDRRVNVVANLANIEDLVKLLRHKEGIVYRFIEVQ